VRAHWSRRDFLKLSGAGVLGAAGASSLAGSAWADGSAPAMPSVTSNTALLGGFAEPAGDIKGYFHAFLDFQEKVDRPVAIYRTYRSWGQPIFNMTIDHILDPEKNPAPPPLLYLSFHAFLDSKGRNCISWADIASGVYDADIDAWAAELVQLGGRPTYVAFHHEMENEEGVPPHGSGGPEDFVAAYWYFRRRLEVVGGVQNLIWVITFMHNTFAPYLKHGGPDRWWPATSPYADVPADHLVGVDIYNRNLCHDKEWRTFESLVDPTLNPGKQPFTVTRFARGKGRRMFVGECGCVEGDACGATLPHGTAKAEWFQEALTLVEAWDDLEALCYSHVTGFADGDYRIDSSPEALASYRGLAASPYFS
jgi:hypothetical protein